MKLQIYLILIFHQTFSQVDDNRIYSYSVEKFNYYKYNEVPIYANLKKIEEVVNSTPERLIESFLSCSSREWDILNTLGGEKNINSKTEEQYKRVTKIDKKKNYIKLINKIDFVTDGIPTSIMKFYIILENTPNPQAGIMVAQQYNSKWYKTSTKMFNDIAFTLLRIKPELFDAIINKDFSNKLVEANKSNIYSNNKLDFYKFSFFINNLKSSQNKEYENFKDSYSIF